MRPLGRLDPVALTANGREPQPIGWVDGDLVVLDGAAEDHPERIEDVGDR